MRLLNILHASQLVLSTLTNDNVSLGLLFHHRHVLHKLDHVHALNHMSKHHVRAVQFGTFARCDEKLATVGIFA